MRKWRGGEDPSGARLTVTGLESRVVDLVPSLRSDLRVRFADLVPLNEIVSMMTVLGPDGEVRTKAAFELEQRTLLPTDPPEHGEASIVVLGTDVAVHDSAEAFAASPDSLLNPRAEVSAEAARLAQTSFLSYGVFGAGPAAQATARMAGVVQSAERRTNALNGETFVVARADTGCFETDVCLSTAEHPESPAPGAVIAGTVFVVASIPQLET